MKKLKKLKRLKRLKGGVGEEGKGGKKGAGRRTQGRRMTDDPCLTECVSRQAEMTDD